MQGVIKDQFESFRSLIRSNISTIRELLEQVSRLSALVENEKNEETKKSLQEIQSNLEAKIEELLSTTEKLFETYKKLL